MLKAQLSRFPVSIAICAPLVACLATGCLVEHRPKPGAGEGDSSEAKEPESSSSQDAKSQTSSSQEAAGSAKEKKESSGDSPSTTNDEKAGEGNCEDERDSICLPPAPQEWQGPVQPQSANEVNKLAPCPVGLNPQDFWNDKSPRQATQTPDAARNIFVDNISAPPAKCTGCETKLSIGDCTPPKYVLRTRGPTDSEPCGKIVEGFRPLHLGPECHTIDFDPNQLQPDQAFSAMPAKPRRQAECAVIKDGVEELPAPTVQNYYRICQGQPMDLSCASANSSCLRFQERHKAPRSPVACVYRRGEHSCPAQQPYIKRTLIYGAMRDNRSCGTCEAKHEVGEIRCGYTVSLTPRDRNRNCAAPELIRPEALCLSARDLKQARTSNAPYSVSGTFTATTYTGSCKASPSWGPTGQASASEPYTLCCTPVK